LSVQPSMAAFSSIIRVIQLLVLLQLLLQLGVYTLLPQGEGAEKREAFVEHLRQYWDLCWWYQ